MRGGFGFGRAFVGGRRIGAGRGVATFARTVFVRTVAFVAFIRVLASGLKLRYGGVRFTGAPFGGTPLPPGASRVNVARCCSNGVRVIDVVALPAKCRWVSVEAVRAASCSGTGRVVNDRLRCVGATGSVPRTACAFVNCVAAIGRG